MKRNQEQKYRIKIIQELQLKKDKQIELDKYISKYPNITYKEIYLFLNHPLLKWYCKTKTFIYNTNKRFKKFKEVINNAKYM